MRIIKRNRKSLGVLLTVMMLLCVTCPMALANSVAEKNIVLQTDPVDNISFDSFDKDGIIANMDKLGIDKIVQDSLISKIENGEMLDSNNPEKLKEISHLLRVSPENPRVEYTFPDGSKFVLESTEINRTVITKVVTQVTYLVTASTSMTSATFYADVMLDKDWPSSYIIRVYSYKITVNAGTFQNVNLSIIDKHETATKPALARLSFDYTLAPGGVIVGSGTMWLDLQVQMGQFFVFYR